MKNKLLTALFGICLVLFMLTFCIGLPIYCRFFYYIQIKTLDLEEQTGWSYGTIKEAYDEVLDYLTLPGKQFGTGELKWSEDGKAHFDDCKVLFDLNLGLLLSSGAVLLLLLILHKLKKIKLVSARGHEVYFYSAIATLALIAILAFLISINFERAFEIFHTVFFPGKTNWTFNQHTDEIILVMPQEFFMNCAIIIGVGIACFTGSLIAADLIRARKLKHKKESPPPEPSLTDTE